MNKYVNFELHAKNHTSSSTANNYVFWSLQCSSQNLGQACLLVNKLPQLNLHSVRVTKGLHFVLERAISVTMERDLPFPGYSTVLSLEPLNGCPNCFISQEVYDMPLTFYKIFCELSGSITTFLFCNH